MPPLVSILVPVYNAEAWLEETLQNALAQTWPRKEIVVVDDGSTDGSLAIAERYAGPEDRVIAQENSGGGAARNRAFAESQGDFIQYLDADDLMDPDKIEVQMNRLQEEPPGTIANVAWCRFVAEPFDLEHVPEESDRDFEDPIDWLVLAGRQRAMSAVHSWLTPRALVELAGPWDESLRVNQDGEFFARVLLAAQRIAFCTGTFAHYRTASDASVSRRSVHTLESELRAAESIIDHMLARSNAESVRTSCAQRLQAFAQMAYPHRPDLVRATEAKIRELGGAEPILNGSSANQLLYKTLGWKRAKRLRRTYYRVRYGQDI